MKKRKFIRMLCLYLITLNLFTACSDNDDESGGKGSGIVGTWEYKQSDGEYIDKYQFKANGTFIETEKEYYNSTGKWETDKNEGSYEFDEDKEVLTLYYSDYYGKGERTITYTVIELNSKTLELKDKYTSSQTYKRI